MSLRGRVAVVTGAGRGIGRAIALALAGEGVRVVLTSRTPHEIEAVAAEVTAAGGESLAVAADVAVEADVRSLFEAAESRFGGPTIVVNNAGLQHRTPFAEYTVADWDRVVDSHLRGMFLVTHMALPHMQREGWGRILTISSMAGKMGVPNRAAYCAAKYGQIGLTEALDEELHASGIRAHVICPGPAASRMRSEGFPDEDPDSLIQPEDLAEHALFLLRLPPTAQIRELLVRPAQKVRHRRSGS